VKTHAHIDEKLFRLTLGCFASGVTVVTSVHGGDIAGTTVSAFASLSLNPPLVLVCLDETSATRALIEQARVFAVNVLAEGQGPLSEHFAQRREEGDPHQFNGVGWRAGTTGSPILEGCHAFADCRVEAVHEGGDHRIYIGRVTSLGVDENNTRPLVYHAGAYRRLEE